MEQPLHLLLYIVLMKPNICNWLQLTDEEWLINCTIDFSHDTITLHVFNNQ